MKEDVSYETEELPVTIDDTIVIYSDGISEAMNKRMTEFGDIRIKKVIKSVLEKSAEELIESMFAVVKNHFGDAPQNDDMTMIVLRRK